MNTIQGFIEVTDTITGKARLVSISKIAVLICNANNTCDIECEAGQDGYITCSESYEEVKGLIADQVNPYLVTSTIPEGERPERLEILKGLLKK